MISAFVAPLPPMYTFADLTIFDRQPAGLGVLLSDIDTGRGRQELFADQVPELLSALATQTRVASIRASNASGSRIPSCCWLRSSWTSSRSIRSPMATGASLAC
jgi:hypothetical protein